jgi:hypothetical protein
MKLWSNVLVHVDRRPDTPEVLEKSLLVAEAFGGRVIAFDSVEPASAPLPFHFPTLRVDHLMEFAAAERAEQLRAELAALDQAVPVEAIVGRGAPGRALLACAANKDSALIVKATSAADVRQMTASGMAALHLLRASQVPVWLFAPPARGKNRIVAAVNLSGKAGERDPLNEHVMLAAAWLSLLESAELHVVCVADRARDRLYDSILRPAQYRRYLAKDREALRRSLTELAARIGPRAVPHLVEGNALEEIEKLVLELEAETVTLARDDADGMPGVDFAERLFCHIDRSVLLVTPDAESVHSRLDFRARARAPHGFAGTM